MEYPAILSRQPEFQLAARKKCGLLLFLTLNSVYPLDLTEVLDPKTADR